MTIFIVRSYAANNIKRKGPDDGHERKQYNVQMCAWNGRENFKDKNEIEIDVFLVVFLKYLVCSSSYFIEH